MQSIPSYLLGLSFMISSSVLADDSICNYESETVERTMGVIDSIKDLSKETADYVEEKRSCMVKFQAKIGEKWVKTHGFYVFGPETSENSACEKAVEKGKIRAITYLSPTELTHIAEQRCKEITPEKEPEVQFIEKRVFVDSETGARVDYNPVSRSLPCFLLSIFARYQYNNPRCNVFTERDNPYVADDALVVPYAY